MIAEKNWTLITKICDFEFPADFSSVANLPGFVVTDCWFFDENIIFALYLAYGNQKTAWCSVKDPVKKNGLYFEIFSFFSTNTFWLDFDSKTRLALILLIVKQYYGVPCSWRLNK